MFSGPILSSGTPPAALGVFFSLALGSAWSVYALRSRVLYCWGFDWRGGWGFVLAPSPVGLLRQHGSSSFQSSARVLFCVLCFVLWFVCNPTLVWAFFSCYGTLIWACARVVLSVESQFGCNLALDLVFPDFQVLLPSKKK